CADPWRITTHPSQPAMVFVLHTVNGLHPWVGRLVRGLLATMLLATLAPAISRTLAASREVGGWVEICSDLGMQWIQVGAHDSESALTDPEALLHALDRCGHCTLAAERFAPLIPALPVVAGDSDPSLAPEHASP